MGDLLEDPITGQLMSQVDRHRMLVEGAVTAEEAGFWSASLGEHHFCDYVVSAPPVVLAAIAERTTKIRLGTAVALGANNDPIRLAEDYATLDVLSQGRVELVVGRGNLYEHTYDAFGQDPTLSRPMYEERVSLLVDALRNEQLDWTGEFRSPFHNYTTQPRPLQDPLPIWVGGGSSIDSAEDGTTSHAPRSFWASKNLPSGSRAISGILARAWTPTARLSGRNYCSYLYGSFKPRGVSYQRPPF